MSFPVVINYNSLNPITGIANPPIGHVFRSPRVNQGPARKNWIYNFFATGTNTPQNVYQDGNLTTPFAPTGQVTADAFGRFPAIYLDNTVAYKVTLSNSLAVVQRTNDPYNPAMATTGSSQLAAFGVTVNAQGEITVTEANAGGSGNALSITAPPGGGPCVTIKSNNPGFAQIIIDSSVTTGAQTATFQSTNRPGNELQYALTSTAPAAGTIASLTLNAAFTGTTSSLYTLVFSTGQVVLGATLTNGATTCTFPSTTFTGTPTAAFTATFSTGVAGWLPIQCDNVTYYAPMMRGNSPYKPIPGSYQGQSINCAGFTFNGTGTVTLTGAGATANPANWFSPPTAGEGALTWFQPTITSNGGLFGQLFVNGLNGSISNSNLAGVWTNIGSGLSVGTLGSGLVVGTYQLSTSAGGTPVVASGSIIIQGGNGVQQQNLNNGYDLFNKDGTITSLGGTTPTPWYKPVTVGIGASYFVNVVQTGGTGTFAGDSTGVGVWDALTVARNFHANNGPVSGTYQISTTASTAGLLCSGSITAGNASGSVQSWSLTGTCLGSIGFHNDGTTSSGWPSWYSPTTTSVGSSHWIKVHVVSITGGGAMTGITADTFTSLASNFTIGLSLPGDLKCTWQISPFSNGSVIEAEGTFEFANNC
jgi:hypothetical protein